MCSSSFHETMAFPVKQHDVEINVSYVLSWPDFINRGTSTSISLEIHFSSYKFLIAEKAKKHSQSPRGRISYHVQAIVTLLLVLLLIEGLRTIHW